MKMNRKTVFRTILCLCMMLMLVLGAVSCNKNGKEGPAPGEVEVVRVTAAMKKGEQITEDKVALEFVDEASVPVNALRSLDAVVGKYLTVDVVVGDYIFNAKITADASNIDNGLSVDRAYISVAYYVKEGEDCTDTIQGLINSNPGRTLYFADGTYTISKPIITSAHPDKKVSFELADYAVIKASDSWSSEDAMIRIGATDGDLFHDEVGPTNTGITGGIIDGNGKAKGIAIEGGRDSAITSVTVRNATVGIVLGDYFGYKAKTVVENTDIIGLGDDSVGIDMTSDQNYLDIVQIDNCGTGVRISGKGNSLRNTHVTYAGSSTSSRGYDDNGEQNNYDFCYAENYASGFYMGADANSSVYTSCYAFWTNKLSKQTAFESEGAFNSVVRSCRADFVDESADASLLTVEKSGGMGKLLYPIVKRVKNIDNATYKSYLGATQVVEVIE